jgi:hypothetical protein
MDNDISLFHSGYSYLYVCDEMIGCEAFSNEGIKRFGKIFLNLLTAAFY